MEPGADRNAQQPAQDHAGAEIAGQDSRGCQPETIEAQEGSGAARACACACPTAERAMLDEIIALPDIEEQEGENVAAWVANALEALREERDAAIRERDADAASDAILRQQYLARSEKAELERDEARAEALKWRRIRTPTHGSCCTCQGCGLDHESCRCDLDEACDRADRSEALLRRCRDTLREVRQTYGPEPGSRVIGLSAILSELDEALS